MAGTERAVVSLSPGDAEALLPLSVEAGWNQVGDDWRFMLAHGRGIGVRKPDGRWIASALVLPLGPCVAWISMVLVTASERRRGLGRMLLGECFDRVRDSGRTAGLDATELGRPVYLGHGFRDVYSLRRWHIPHVLSAAAEPMDGIAVRRLQTADLPAVASFDAERTGLERTRMLSELVRRNRDMAFVAETGGATMLGYVTARSGRIATQIGPVVAERDEIAVALIARAIGAGSQPFVLDVPDRHSRITLWLEAHGATAPRGFMRMIRGGDVDLAPPSRVFAIAGPELG